MSLKVFSECCKNCLLSADRIVSPKRAMQIIKVCISSQSYFICHKATIKSEEIVCKNFYEQFGEYSQMIRIADSLGCTEFVPQTDSEKLITYKEMEEKRGKS